MAETGNLSTAAPAIDPLRAYSFGEVAALLPSARPGKKLHLRTLHRWRERKILRAFKLSEHWFVYGSEILRLLQDDQRPAWSGRSPTQVHRDSEAARQHMRDAFGMDV